MITVTEDVSVSIGFDGVQGRVYLEIYGNVAGEGFYVSKNLDKLKEDILLGMHKALSVDHLMCPEFEKNDEDFVAYLEKLTLIDFKVAARHDLEERLSVML